MIKIAVDAMGGDYAPLEIVLGAIRAVRDFGVHVVLVGDKDQIEKILKNENEENNELIEIHHASQVIGMDEHPGLAFRKKKDASISVGAKLVRSGECKVLVAPGSTGAAVTAGLLGIGRIPGIERPAILTPLPNEKGEQTFLIDSGASAQPKKETYLQNALLGYVYAKYVANIENPKIGLLNIGEESVKGSPEVTAANKLLSEQKAIPFMGNVEGRYVMTGEYDVVVTDGFTGNVVLKFGEGAGHLFSALIKESVKKGGLRAKIGGWLLKPALKEHLVKRMDYSEYGGALLLGIRGGLIICHGSSKSWAIRNAIKLAKDVAKTDLHEIIAEALKKIEKNDETEC